jgi:hypothetical protein
LPEPAGYCRGPATHFPDMNSTFKFRHLRISDTA